jgi:hypothetical protein
MLENPESKLAPAICDRGNHNPHPGSARLSTPFGSPASASAKGDKTQVPNIKPMTPVETADTHFLIPLV